MTQYTLRRIAPEDKPVVTALLTREWGGVELVAFALGGTVDASTLPGWIAERDDGEVLGLLTYLRDGDSVELVTVNRFTPDGQAPGDGRGVGAALIDAVVDELVNDVRAAGVVRIGVTTTNDNTRALRFYQRAGFRLRALHVGAVARARQHKPQIPELGHDDIPITDELELELRIQPK